jgi:GT2 family glycosyltransferase
VKVEQARTVGVVTVLFNSAEVLPDFLDSLAAQAGVLVRLYAVDNASRDASVELVRSESRFHVSVIPNDDNLGVAVGNNQGIAGALADGVDWVLLLNNDTLFDADTLAIMAAAAAEEGAQIMSPLIAATDPPGTVWYSTGHLVPWQGFRAFHDDVGAALSQRSVSYRTDYASTCALLVDPAVFREVGMMDPVYFVYFDDVDFAVRAKRSGFEYWVTTKALVTHKASSLTGGKHSAFTIEWTSRNWPLVALRNLSGARATLALLFILSWAAGRFILRRDSLSIFATRLRAYRKGFRARNAPPAPRATA